MSLKISTLLGCILLIAGISCKKEKAKEPTVVLSTQESILKIAPSEQRFNEWIELILKHKVGKYETYSVNNVTVSEKNDFKIAEVAINIDGVVSNCIITTLLEFVQAPKINEYVLRPITDMPTPTRTLIFSSGKSSVIDIHITNDTIYTIKTNAKNLFYLGTME